MKFLSFNISLVEFLFSFQKTRNATTKICLNRFKLFTMCLCDKWPHLKKNQLKMELKVAFFGLLDQLNLKQSFTTILKTPDKLVTVKYVSIKINQRTTYITWNILGYNIHVLIIAFFTVPMKKSLKIVVMNFI